MEAGPRTGLETIAVRERDCDPGAGSAMSAPLSNRQGLGVAEVEERARRFGGDDAAAIAAPTARGDRLFFARANPSHRRTGATAKGILRRLCEGTWRATAKSGGREREMTASVNLWCGSTNQPVDHFVLRVDSSPQK